MKKIFFCLMTTCMLSGAMTTTVSASNAIATTTTSTTKANEAAEAKVLLNRLYEIKAMDKSDIGPSEKSELRTEVQTIRTQLAAIGGGVYISAGALIVILILLIIFL